MAKDSWATVLRRPRISGRPVHRVRRTTRRRRVPRDPHQLQVSTRTKAPGRPHSNSTKRGSSTASMNACPKPPRRSEYQSRAARSSRSASGSTTIRRVIDRCEARRRFRSSRAPHFRQPAPCESCARSPLPKQLRRPRRVPHRDWPAVPRPAPHARPKARRGLLRGGRGVVHSSFSRSSWVAVVTPSRLWLHSLT